MECSPLNEEIKKLLLPASETDAFKVIHTFTSTSNFSLKNFYKKFNI